MDSLSVEKQVGWAVQGLGWFMVFGTSVGRVFGGVIGTWTVRNWFRMLLGFAFFALSSFSSVQDSLALTAGVTCAAVDDVYFAEDPFGGDDSGIQILSASPNCAVGILFANNGNKTGALAPIAVLLNTNHDGTPLFWEGLRIDYFAASITEVRVDGVLYTSGAPIGSAITANAFSHTV